MEFTCAVWFEGILAHYHVVETGRDMFVIRLLHCITKTTISVLPRKITLYKRAEEWISDYPNPDFIADLVSAITQNTMIDTLLCNNDEDEVLLQVS